MSYDAERFTEKKKLPNRPAKEMHERKGYIPSYLEGSEECVVCGDNATGYHYRCITCEGCKGFFRRSVQKNLQKRYCCKKRNVCEINKVSRNQCQRCRYTKCIRVGMATELVLNEDKRVAKRRLIEHNRKLRLHKEENIPTMSADSSSDITIEQSKLLIAEIAKAHLESFEAKKVTESVFLTCSKLPPVERFSTVLTKAITGVVDFAKRISWFSNSIEIEDQVKILKYSCMDAIVVRATASYDEIQETLDLFPLVIVTHEQLCRTSLNACADALFQLARDFSLLKFSNVDRAVLEAIVIFKDRPNTSHVTQREQGFKQILQAFHHHINETFPSRPNIWHKILEKVNEVRCVSESLAQAIMTMRNDDNEVLNPFFVTSMRSLEKPRLVFSTKNFSKMTPSVLVAPQSNVNKKTEIEIPTVNALTQDSNTNRSMKKDVMQPKVVLPVERTNILEDSEEEKKDKNQTLLCTQSDLPVQTSPPLLTADGTAFATVRPNEVPLNEPVKNKGFKRLSFLNDLGTNKQQNALKQTFSQKHLTQTRQQIIRNQGGRQALRYGFPSFRCDPVFHFPNPFLLGLPISPTPFGIPRFSSSASVLMERSLRSDQKSKPACRPSWIDIHKPTNL